jgi:hypothetical protein
MTQQKQQYDKTNIFNQGISWLFMFMLSIPAMNASAFDLVSIKSSSNKKYMHSTGNSINFTKDTVKATEKYIVTDVGDGKVSLKCENGKYLTASWGGYYWLAPLSSGSTYCSKSL